MLSRVADDVYWTARYVERAECVARLLHVNFHSLLDTNVADRDAAWLGLVAITGHGPLFAEHFEHGGRRAVSEFLLWHRANPDSMLACVTRARENARGVREQISAEIWEHLNRLYHFVRDARRDAVERAPHDFLTGIREGSHAFQGIAKATMTHGAAYDFLELGTHLERAALTARILNVKHAELERLPPGDPAPAIALLRSCGALESFREHGRSQLVPGQVAAYLLLERSFPRTILFCLESCLETLKRIGGGDGQPERTLGRLCSELAFSDPRDLLDQPLRETLDPLIGRLAALGDEIAAAYFNTQLIAPRSFVLADAAANQQQQQQQ